MKNEEASAKALFEFRHPERESQFSYTYRVTFGDTDAMEIVHHATYVHMMERARIAFMDETRWSYKFWADQGIHLPVVDLSLHYGQSFAYDDLIHIFVRLETKGVRLFLNYDFWPVTRAKSVQLGTRYDLPRPKQQAYVSGQTVHVAMDPDGNAKRLSHVLNLFKKEA